MSPLYDFSISTRLKLFFFRCWWFLNVDNTNLVQSYYFDPCLPPTRRIIWLCSRFSTNERPFETQTERTQKKTDRRRAKATRSRFRVGTRRENDRRHARERFAEHVCRSRGKQTKRCVRRVARRAATGASRCARSPSTVNAWRHAPCPRSDDPPRYRREPFRVRRFCVRPGRPT